MNVGYIVSVLRLHIALIIYRFQTLSDADHRGMPDRSLCCVQSEHITDIGWNMYNRKLATQLVKCSQRSGLRVLDQRCASRGSEES